MLSNETIMTPEEYAEAVRSAAIRLRSAAFVFAKAAELPAVDDDDRAYAAANKELLRAARAYAAVVR